MSHAHITKFRGGFPGGYTKIIGLDGVAQNTGMEFGILKLSGSSNVYSKSSRDAEYMEMGLETQLIVLNGRGTIEFHGRKHEVARESLFTQNPWAFNLPCATPFRISAERGEYLEVAIIKAQNNKIFEPVVLRPEDIPSEQRGEGLAGGTMHRVVRAIFGDPNAIERARPPESNLVVGEVINFPGRWSSYPPHYHPHAEVYYYRFDRPEGFGVSLIDDPAPVVRDRDVVKIMNCAGHAQVAAPGYAMWYLWFIRQIDGNRYEGNPPFTFFPEHAWINDPEAKILTPKNVR